MKQKIDIVNLTLTKAAKMANEFREAELEKMVAYHKVPFAEIKDRIACEMAAVEGTELYTIDGKKALEIQRVVDIEEGTIDHIATRYYRHYGKEGIIQ